MDNNKMRDNVVKEFVVVCILLISALICAVGSAAVLFRY